MIQSYFMTVICASLNFNKSQFLFSPPISVTVMPQYILGIDLGTSTTCVAFIDENGKRSDIPIHADARDSEPCMPSVVAFGLNGDLLIGEKAYRQAVTNPRSTIYEFKRLMGRSYYDDANHTFAYRVRPTLKSHSLKGARAAVEIPCGTSHEKLIEPELLSAILLRYVADHAKKEIGVSIKDAVISVPAIFDDSQRKATKDAGLIAGLDIIKIVNEPTVAAFAANNMTEKLIATDLENNNRETATKLVIVADIGGGTSDYALMQITEYHKSSAYVVKHTGGDKTQGGRDIDIALAKNLTKILQDKYRGLNLTGSLFQQKLRLKCEEAKIILSNKEQYFFTVKYIDEDSSHKQDLPYDLSRDAFEEVVSDILHSMVKPLDSLLHLAQTQKGHIDELYLVGGTSSIPKLQELLLRYRVNNQYVCGHVRHEMSCFLK